MNRDLQPASGRPSGERLGHRPGLDGLRGVAVLLVLGQHLSIPVFQGGGLVGVLLFFVLSGVLITWLLLDEMEATGRISLRAFYARRARRLVPAFLVMLLVVTAAAAIDGNLEAIARPVLVSGLYLSYYADALGVALGPLNHTWTLSVEEQFYLVWPAVLIGLFALRRLRWLLLAMCGAAVFWFMPMTGGAIAIGAVVGAVVRRGWIPTVPAAIGWASLLSLVILGALVGTGWTTPNPVKVVILAVGSMAAIWAVQSPVLGWKPLAGVGRISYGLYLWHVPINWALYPILSATLPWPAVTAILATASFAAALLSWHFVERPFRRRAHREAGPARTPVAVPPVRERFRRAVESPRADLAGRGQKRAVGGGLTH